MRILTSPGQGGQFRDGEVLVAPMTAPDWVSTMRRAAALVTDAGGMTCHAAIVSRELGVPGVVVRSEESQILSKVPTTSPPSSSSSAVRSGKDPIVVNLPELDEWAEQPAIVYAEAE